MYVCREFYYQMLKTPVARKGRRNMRNGKGPETESDQKDNAILLAMTTVAPSSSVPHIACRKRRLLHDRRWRWLRRWRRGRRVWLQRHAWTAAAAAPAHGLDVLAVLERLRKVANVAVDVLVAVEGKRQDGLAVSEARETAKRGADAPQSKR